MRGWNFRGKLRVLEEQVCNSIVHRKREKGVPSRNRSIGGTGRKKMNFAHRLERSKERRHIWSDQRIEGTVGIGNRSEWKQCWYGTALAKKSLRASVSPK